MPSMIRLTKNASLDHPRSLSIPLWGLAWLNVRMLVGMALLAATLCYVAWMLQPGNLPPDLALMLERAETPATIDGVQIRHKTVGKGMKSMDYLHRYHFQLPNGIQMQGSSVSMSKRTRAEATAFYYPPNPNINCLEGMSPEHEGGLRFMTIVAAASLILITLGTRHGWIVHRSLRYGAIGHATIVACDTKRNLSIFGLQLARANEIPLAQFQSKVWEKYRSLFDDKGDYVGTTWTQSVSLTIAFGSGLFFGSIAGAMVTLIALQKMGFPQIVTGMCIGASLGAIVMVFLEMRLKWILRGNAPKRDAKPSEFVRCPCLLEVIESKTTMPLRIAKKLDLAGDSSDQQPRTILYQADRPMNAVLLSELLLTERDDEESGTILLGNTRYPHRFLALAVILVATIGCLLAMLTN